MMNTTKNWQKIKLGVLIKLNYGKGLPEAKRTSGDTPVYGSNGIVGYHNESLIKVKGIIIGRKGTIGQIEWANSDFWPIDTTYYIQEDNKYDLLWLYYLLRSLNLKNLNRATGVPGLNREDVYKIDVYLPDRKIQQKIAACLQTVDIAIQKTDQVIQKTEVLKQGLMQGLLTKGIGHKKFKKTKLGEIPEEWDLVRIEQTSQVKGGKRLPKGTPFATEVTSHPYLRIVDFKNMTINTSNIKYIDENIFKQISRYIISKEDVYISIAGTIGIVGLIPEELNGASLTENAAKIIIQKGFVKEYLAYFLSSSLGQSQIRDLTVKTTQPKLALNKIEQILIPIPPLDEQKKIIKILSGLFSKIENENEQKEALLILKKGLMQDIFSQKVQIN